MEVPGMQPHHEQNALPRQPELVKDGLYIIPLKKKEKIKLAKEEIKQRKAELKKLKVRLKVIEGQLGKSQPSDRTYLEIGHWKWHAKVRTPIAHRMVAFVEQTKLRKEIRIQQKELRQLQNFVKNPVIKVGQYVVGGVLLGRRRYRGLKPKTGRRPILPKSLTPGATPATAAAKLPSPWQWYKMAEAWLNTAETAVAAVKNVSRARTLKGLQKDGNKRLEEIAKEKLQHISGTPEYTALVEEEKFTREVIGKLHEELMKTPVIETAGQTAIGLLSMSFDVAALTHIVSSILPTLVVSTQILRVTEVVGLAAAGVTVPLAVIFTTIGIAGTIDNFRTCIGDLFLVRGYSDKKLEGHKLNLQALDDLLDQNITDPTAVDILSRANDGIRTAQDKLRATVTARIEFKDKASQKTLKALHAEYEREIKAWQHSCEMELQAHIESLDPAERPPLERLLIQFQTRRVAERSAEALQTTIIPYVSQKATTKLVSTTVRASFDCITLTATGLTLFGFGSMVFGGGGAVVLPVAGTLGLIGTYGQISCGFLVKRLRIMQLNIQGTRIRTKQLDTEMLKRLREEVKNWDNLTAAGLEDKTAAAVMFSVLKKNYMILPPHWGPKEWAESLINDDSSGPERARYGAALSTIGEHDTFGVVRRVALWPARKLYSRWASPPKSAKAA